MELILSENAVCGNSPGHQRAMSTLASVESLSIPLQMQEVVLSADIRCVECQRRIAEVMSRMRGLESVTVSASQKKVALSCRYSHPANAKAPEKQVPAAYRKSPNKASLVKKIFRGFSTASRGTSTKGRQLKTHA